MDVLTIVQSFNKPDIAITDERNDFQTLYYKFQTRQHRLAKIISARKVVPKQHNLRTEIVTGSLVCIFKCPNSKFRKDVTSMAQRELR
jgi:hypothetical protein